MPPSDPPTSLRRLSRKRDETEIKRARGEVSHRLFDVLVIHDSEHCRSLVLNADGMYSFDPVCMHTYWF